MVRTALTAATAPLAPARPISAVAAGTVASGAVAADPFGAVLGQVGSTARGTPADTPVNTVPGILPASPAPIAQPAPPGQQSRVPLASGQDTPTSTKQDAGTEDTSAAATAKNPVDDVKAVDPALVAMPPPAPVPIPPPPPSGPSLATPSQTGDSAPPSGAAGTPSIAGLTNTATLATAQAAVMPPSAQPADRLQGNGLASNSPEKAPQHSDQPGSNPSGSLPVTAAPQAAAPSQANPVASPVPGAAVAQPRPSARSAKTASDSAETASPQLTSPPVATPEIAASSTPTVATAVAASVAAATMSAPASPTLMPQSARQLPAQPTSAPGSPAGQVAQAIVEPVKVLMSSPGQAASAAPHVMTIQITPAELGRVDVRIERSVEGPSTIQLVAERPETLSRLVHDQSQLHQALDQAGIPQAGRTLDFSLAPTPTPDFAASSTFTGSFPGGFHGSGQQRSGGTYVNQASGAVDDAMDAAATLFRPTRTGIDITA